MIRWRKALKQHFQVWYDKYQLAIGDSLLSKITEGLASCDFGIVVLSKAFFAKKKWTENELGGSFALENATRKIILPVWKDVTFEDVKAYSPILADCVAALGRKGIDSVVGEIQVAVSVANRKDEIAEDVPTTKVRELVQTLEINNSSVAPRQFRRDKRGAFATM